MAPPQLTDAPQSSTPQEWLSTLPGELCAQDTDLLGRVQLNCSDRGLMSVPQALSPNTEVLILSHNSLTSVSLSSLKDLPQLRNLDLSNNQIAHFQADYRLPLERLDLSHNKLSVIPRLSSLARLEGLQLASNAISALSDQAFGGLGNLKDLNLQDNQIEDISGHAFDPLVQLKFLSLSSNRIQVLPPGSMDSLTGLETLDLSHNRISLISEDLVKKSLELVDLSLSGNRIQGLPNGVFDGLDTLRFLSLSSNQISLLPELLLKHLDLAGLDLSRNRLTTIPQGFFEGKNLSFVFLHSNRWHCDCTVQYLTSWSAENNGNVYTERDIPDPKGFVCASPPELQGTPVVRFPARQLCQVLFTRSLLLIYPTLTETRHRDRSGV
uniref:LRRCT domain-containing protein n=1 Tax=Callorhinchus milii TaxID=7868 RepID=A0A4W3GNZ6_CALMI